MTEMAKYLTEVKAKLGIKSDSQLALKIGISQTMVSHIMLGYTAPGDDVCVKIAKIAGDSPEYVMLLAHKSKATEATRPYWDHIFKLFEVISKKPALAASLALFLAFPFLAQGGSDFSLHNVTGIYLMRH